MEDTAEDSDATIAGDEVEEPTATQVSTDRPSSYPNSQTQQVTITHSGEGNTSDNNEQLGDTGPSSPSLLQCVRHLSLNRTASASSHVHSREGSCESRDKQSTNAGKVKNGLRMEKETRTESDTVPCSSSDEEMSQEFPPLQTTTQPSLSVTASNPPQNLKFVTAQDPAMSSANKVPSLNNIDKEQSALLFSLKNAKGVDEKFTEQVKKSASELEQHLKAINLANQSERKRLATQHTLLLSQSQSQLGGVSTESSRQSIRAQLIELAAKQKQLLQCFVKQKEILSEVNKLSQTIQQRNAINSLTAGTHDKITTTATYGHIQVSNTSNVSHVSSTISSSVNSTLTTSKVSQPKALPYDARNTTISVAFPNLSKHLLQSQALPQHVKFTNPSTSVQQSLQATCTAQSSSQIQPECTYSQPAPHVLPSTSILQATHTAPYLPSSTSLQQSLQPPRTAPSASLAQIRSEHAYTAPQQSHPATLGHHSQTTRAPVTSTVGGKGPVTSNDLSHPVPLKTLMKHGLIQPGKDCISCTILGCDFKASLSADASIVSQDGSKHQLPQQWVKSCWARLGHPNKVLKKKGIYSSVLYNGVALLHYCEKYSLNQVSSYLSQNSQIVVTEKEPHVQYTHSQTTEPKNSSHVDTQASSRKLLPGPVLAETVAMQPNSSVHLKHPHITFDIGRILTSGSVFVRRWSPHWQTNLELSEEFWGQCADRECVLPPAVIQQIECDLEW